LNLKPSILVNWLYYFGFLPWLSIFPPALGIRMARSLTLVKNPRFEERRSVMAQSLNEVRPAFPSPLPDSIPRDLASLEIWEETEPFQYPRWNSRNVASKFDFQGLDRLDEVLQNGHGAIVMAAHFGLYCSGLVALGLTGIRQVFLANDTPNDPRFSGPNRKHSELKMRRMTTVGKGRFVLLDLEQGVTTPAVRELLRALEQNHVVVVVLDVPPHFATATESAEFLGRECRFPVGLFRLASLSGAPVVPMFCPVREGRRKVILEPCLNLTGDLAKDLQAGVSLLDRYVREFPAQWFLWDSLSHFLIPGVEAVPAGPGEV